MAQLIQAMAMRGTGGLGGKHAMQAVGSAAATPWPSRCIGKVLFCMGQLRPHFVWETWKFQYNRQTTVRWGPVERGVAQGRRKKPLSQWVVEGGR